MFGGVLALWQSTAQHELTPGYRPEGDLTVPGRHWLCAPTSSGGLCINPFQHTQGPHPLLRLLPPFANRIGLRLGGYPETSAQGRSGVLLHAVTRLLGPELQHYYGFICHLAPTLTLAFTLVQCPLRSGCGVRLPRLLHRLPVNDATLKHSPGLTEYRASRYFAR